MVAKNPLPQSDDSYERITFCALRDRAEADGPIEGTVGWREGAQNRVVFQVWDGPSFAAEGADLAAAFATARAGIVRAGFAPLAPSDGSLGDLFANAEAENAGSPPRFQPILWLLVAAILVALLIPALARAEIPARAEAVPFPNSPYEWQLDSATGMSCILTIRKQDGDEYGRDFIARYELEHHQFCEGMQDNCELDGIFPLTLSGMAQEPILGVVAHIGVHGQKLSIFRPLRDKSGPVFKAVADYALDLRLRRDGLDVTIDHAIAGGEASHEQLHWPTAPAPQRVKPTDITLPQAPPLSHSAGAFDTRLRNIAAARDLAGFMAFLTDDVLVSFGGSGGKAEFAAQWKLKTEPGRTQLWATLDRLLAHGGWNEAGEADYPQRLTYPWFFTAWPDGVDAENRLIANEDAALRAAPDPAAPVLARLPRAAVLYGRAVEGDEALEWVGHGWLDVIGPGGSFGFVRREDVALLLDTRLVAVEPETGWRIEAMVAGD